MTEFQFVNEFLSTAAGTEGSLLIPKKIYDTLIDAVDKVLLPRSEAAFYIGPAQIPGSSIDIDLVTPDSLNVRELGEGGEIPMDIAAYTSTNVKPVKFGVALRITKEMMEDAKWNLMAHNVKMAGKKLAENENSLVITELDNAAQTVSGSGAITIADITRAMQHLEDADYEPTSFAIGMEVANDLRNIDTFVEVNKAGNNDMLTKGFIGNIYGMKVFKVSTNAGMTTSSSYVYDNNEAYCIAEKRPITLENFKLPLVDSEGAAITQRLRVKYLRTAGICKITT